MNKSKPKSAGASALQATNPGGRTMNDVHGQKALLSLSQKVGRSSGAEKIPPLPSEEWNFSDCPEEQLLPCLCYETWREQKEVFRKISKYRENPTKFIREHEHRYRGEWWMEKAIGCGRCCPSWLWSAFPEFPQTPWLAIHKETRVERISNRWNAYLKRRKSLEASVENLKDAEGNYQSFVIDRQMGRQRFPILLAYAVIKVDWSKSDSELMDRFALFLKAWRPETAQVKERRGKTSERDRLKQLGAWRLLRHCGGNWELAAQMSIAAYPDDPDAESLYSNQSAWLRAAAKAKRMKPVKLRL